MTPDLPCEAARLCSPSHLTVHRMPQSILYIPSHQVFSTFQRLTGRWRVKGHAVIRRWIVITCVSAAVTPPVFTLGRVPLIRTNTKYAGQRVCACVLCRLLCITGHSADGGNVGAVKLRGCCHKAEDDRTTSIKQRGSLKG